MTARFRFVIIAPLGPTVIDSLINHYGLLALGGLIFFESLGLPLPGETVLLLAAAAAAQQLMPISAVIVVAALATIGGGMLGYAAGRRYGFMLLTRYGTWISVTPTRLAQAQAFFQRHGPPTIVLGRFVALLRVLTAILAGAGQMPIGPFLCYNALGGILWAALIGALGYAFGQQLPQLERWIGEIGWGAVMVLVLAGLVAAVWTIWQRRSHARPRS